MKKVWLVLKVHLAQLAHRVLVGDREKLVKEETWAKKVNLFTMLCGLIPNHAFSE